MQWITHVGISVGNGLMPNAPTTATLVREMLSSKAPAFPLRAPAVCPFRRREQSHRARRATRQDLPALLARPSRGTHPPGPPDGLPPPSAGPERSRAGLGRAPLPADASRAGRRAGRRPTAVGQGLVGHDPAAGRAGARIDVITNLKGEAHAGTADYQWQHGRHRERAEERQSVHGQGGGRRDRRSRRRSRSLPTPSSATAARRRCSISRW
jgi:hypothetical protein